jgi:hypothetical protein
MAGRPVLRPAMCDHRRGMLPPGTVVSNHSYFRRHHLPVARQKSSPSAAMSPVWPRIFPRRRLRRIGFPWRRLLFARRDSKPRATTGRVARTSSARPPAAPQHRHLSISKLPGHRRRCLRCHALHRLVGRHRRALSLHRSRIRRRRRGLQFRRRAIHARPGQPRVAVCRGATRRKHHAPRVGRISRPTRRECPSTSAARQFRVNKFTHHRSGHLSGPTVRFPVRDRRALLRRAMQPSLPGGRR